MSEGKSRRQYLTLQALHPATHDLTAEVQISYDRMQAVGRRSLGHAKECGLIVPAVLREPTAIFQGLRRDEDEDKHGVGWLCYCGIPDRSFRSDGTPSAAYATQVYVIFINDDGVAYNWRWEKADADDPSLPEGHQTRFKKRLL